MSIENTYARHSKRELVLILFVCTVVGYGFFVPELLLLDDDIAGRYKAIANPNTIQSQVDLFKRWTMGRPFGHIANVSFQGIFLNFKEWVIIAFAVAAIAAQSIFLKSILEKTGFSSTDSSTLAVFFFVTPIATSLYLPVHAFATEASTWCMLGATWMLLDRRPVFAGLFAGLQFAIYESYVTIFWMPVAFLFIQQLFRQRVSYRELFQVGIFFTIVFGAMMICLIAIRLNMPGSGREAGILDMGIGKVISRMFEAGWIGTKTSLAFQVESIQWSLKNGPKYIIALFILVPCIVYRLLRKAQYDINRTSRLPLFSIFTIGIIGLLLVYCSYMIYYEQRFPPQVKVSRLANIHSAARFGITLMFGCLLLLSHTCRNFSKVFISIVIGSFLVFQHSYGFQEAQSSTKKMAVLDALELACLNAINSDVIAVVTPIQMSSRKTDIVLGWTTPYIAPTSFEAWQNKVVIVPHNHAQAFLSTLELNNTEVSFEQLRPYVHKSYTLYKWLYPWGDIDRWKNSNSTVRVVQIEHVGDAFYSQKLLTKEFKLQTNFCVRR